MEARLKLRFPCRRLGKVKFNLQPFPEVKRLEGTMPREIHSEEEFLQVAERARVCRVKKLKDGTVKLKLRTPGYLYTFKVKEEESEEILKKIKCPVEEV